MRSKLDDLLAEYRIETQKRGSGVATVVLPTCRRGMGEGCKGINADLLVAVKLGSPNSDRKRTPLYSDKCILGEPEGSF